MPFFSAIVVCTNLAFTTAFDTARNLPVWAAYNLAPSNVVKAERAPFGFRVDPRAGYDIGSFFSSNHLDRGHLVPAADMNWNTDALRQTYLFTNICPMTPALNRGPWRATEDEVRRLASSSLVHVVIVPVYSHGAPRGGRIAPPASFVKVAYGDFGARFWHISQNVEIEEEEDSDNGPCN